MKENIATNVNIQLDNKLKINTDTKLEKTSDISNFENQETHIDIINNRIYNTDSDTNLQLIKCIPGLSIRSEFRFRPINKKWQKFQCEKLGLIYVGNDFFKNTKNSILHPPVENFKIEGDGNCFFRCISLCITGTQEQHQDIRKIITEYIQKNEKEVENFSGVKNYLKNTKMAELTIWASDVEIYFTAKLLEVNIYTFTSNPKGIFHWLRFPASNKNTEQPNDKKMGIYLNHKNSNHFEVVIKVKKQPHYYKVVKYFILFYSIKLKLRFLNFFYFIYCNLNLFAG